MSTVNRILDANANRAREAMRVMEDAARFGLDDAKLTRSLKKLRHDFAAALRRLPAGVTLDRDTPGDVGTAITTKAEQVKEFTLLRAYPDQKNDGLSLALEFSRPLVGTQDFDKLVRFEEKVGTDDSSWTLSDDGLTLRYPFVEAGKEFSLAGSETPQV